MALDPKQLSYRSNRAAALIALERYEEVRFPSPGPSPAALPPPAGAPSSHASHAHLRAPPPPCHAPRQAAEECGRCIVRDAGFSRVYQRLGSISARPGGLDACLAGIQAVAKEEKDKCARASKNTRFDACAAIWRLASPLGSQSSQSSFPESGPPDPHPPPPLRRSEGIKRLLSQMHVVNSARATAKEEFRKKRYEQAEATYTRALESLAETSGAGARRNLLLCPSTRVGGGEERRERSGGARGHTESGPRLSRRAAPGYRHGGAPLQPRHLPVEAREAQGGPVRRGSLAAVRLRMLSHKMSHLTLGAAPARAFPQTPTRRCR